MKTTIKFLIIVNLIALSIQCTNKVIPASDIQTSAMFSDNMVLQQNRPIPVWGKASPGGNITVTFKDQIKSTVVQKDSSWQVALDPCTFGGPFELKLIGKDTISMKNVMVGEVWICSGQSNMSYPLIGWKEINHYEQEIANANYSDIRLMTVDKKTELTPADHLKTKGWNVCSPESVPNFSAVAYFFGKKLHDELQIPIGLIQSSWGGTPAEAWTPSEFLQNFDVFKSALEAQKNYKENKEQLWLAYYNEVDKWKQKLDSINKENIIGLTFEKPEKDDSKWKTIDIPSYWENSDLGDVDGFVRFRKTITISEENANKKFVLYLGTIDDHDATYFNGVCIGSIYGGDKPRVYNVPKGLIKTGKNVIGVQVFDNGNNGGFGGKKEDIYLIVEDGVKIDLSGIWKYKFLMDNSDMLWMPDSPDGPSNPTVLYNAMINPLIPYAIQGAIWYQGEANVGRSEQYATLFPTMINAWRDKWGQGDFPFIFVQLANFLERGDEPPVSNWAKLRDAQTKALDLPNTGMAVTIDIGEANDIHPWNKHDVGLRLALNALHIAYDKDIPYSSPTYTSMKIAGSKIEIVFENIYGGLQSKNSDSLLGFVIAGADGKYKVAKAKVDGDIVVVWNESIQNPVSVRYAWADSPKCNLYNSADLPAVPFKTDINKH